MHRLIFGHSFAEVVALILLPVLAFYILNKKKARVRGNAEDYDTDTSGSSTIPIGTNFGGGSSSTPTETTNGASSASTAPFGDCYEVFLSFRGQDIRDGFADHLYHGLDDARINTFRDNEKLRRGKKIGNDLFAAIKNSKILIPILSVNYGTSSWCLDELVQIMECEKNNKETIVLPIFYKVEPSDVRHQTGKFGKAFHDRVKRRGFDSTTLKKWKEALEKVSSLRGHNATGPEGELVKSIVREVLSELIAKFQLDVPENLIGIDSHVKEVMKFVANNSLATLFVGIHGMGGIGKTTLAKTIYNKLLKQFEYRSFIADIREKYKNGVEHLHNKLIRDIMKEENLVRNRDEGIKLLSSKFKGKKVLILLDDLDADVHLKDLAGSRDWFFPGSVIIITTRDESILDKARVDYKHDHQVLDKDSSLILFSRHAFRENAPPSEFEKLTNEVVSTTGRLPLSLKVVGSFLCDKLPEVWEDAIKQLRNVPDKEVRETLKISYDALEKEQKQIFLDIACFFINTDLRIASYMWDACDFYPNKGIEVLKLRSLIKVGKKHELRMHDQLRDLGREIVHREDEGEPGNRSRLWDSKEAMEVLKEDEGTEKIEAIYLSKDSSVGFGKTIDQGDDILTGKQFKKLRNLRFLNASGAHFSGDFKNSIKKLKWLQWKKCPPTFEAKNFHVEELHVLNLRGCITFDEWQGWSWIKMAKKLKYLELSDCEFLELTFFPSSLENLEVLILRDCKRLKQIDSSIGNMKSLVRLELRGCNNLEGLPTEVGRLKALEQLHLTHSQHLFSLPDSIGDLQNLEILNINGTEIKELPDSIGDLQNLEILDISGSRIKELPNSIGRLRKLRVLDASRCVLLGGDMLESVRNLSSLQRLDLFECCSLRSLSVLPSSLTYLGVTCQSPRLPSLSNLTRLKELYLYECQFLECIGDHPSTLLEKSRITPFELEILAIDSCGRMITLDVSQFNHLRTLIVDECTNLLEIRGLDELKYLERLDIRCCHSIKRLDLPKSEGLKKLLVRLCEKLVEIQGLDGFEFLKELNISYCSSIERLNLPKSENLEILNAAYCTNLIDIQSTNRLESLKKIDISGCKKIVRLDLSKSEGLKIFHASDCEKLIEIQGLDRLEYLEDLNMWGCTSFIRLPDLCCFDTLHDLAINCRDNLDDIQNLKIFPSLTTLHIGEYNKSLAKFPTFRHLQSVTLSNCHELREILGLEELTSLMILVVEDCEKLTELRGLEKLENLSKLDIRRCKSLKRIPKLRGRRVYFEPVLEEEEGGGGVFLEETTK